MAHLVNKWKWRASMDLLLPSTWFFSKISQGELQWEQVALFCPKCMERHRAPSLSPSPPCPQNANVCPPNESSFLFPERRE